MPSVLKDIIGGILSPVAGIIDALKTDDVEKAQAKSALIAAQAALEQTVQASIQAEMDAKSKVLVAELQQGDSYTKRARPTVVYAGLVVLAINHIILPWIAFFVGKTVPNIDIPAEFWWGWSGIVTTWVIGRTAERRGLQNRVTGIITGSD